MNNPRGLKLQFAYPEAGSTEIELRIPDYFRGWRNVTHGGFLAMLLDETMAHACLSMGKMMVTADMSVRYVNPVEVGTTIKAEARVAEQRGRIVSVEGRITAPDGLLVARASARFLATGDAPADRS
jgi:uncharacterized protein (TIGR00369 family)